MAEKIDKFIENYKKFIEMVGGKYVETTPHSLEGRFKNGEISLLLSDEKDRIILFTLSVFPDNHVTTWGIFNPSIEDSDFPSYGVYPFYVVAYNPKITLDGDIKRGEIKEVHQVVPSEIEENKVSRTLYKKMGKRK